MSAEDNKLRKRLRLMDAALELFTTRGLTRTSVEDISKSAGVAKGTFYLYFRDKYDLHQRLIQHECEKLLRHAAENADLNGAADPAERLLLLTDDILAQLQGNRLLLQFLGRDLGWGLLHRAADPSGQALRPVIEEVFGPGAADDEARRIELFTVLELIGSTCRSVILDGDPVDIETFRPYLHRSVRAVMESFRAA